MKFYTGVGSRETPADVMDFMEELAFHLAQDKWVLRSGGAQGADSAFETGCDQFPGRKEIFIPWPGFSGTIGKCMHYLLSDSSRELQQEAEKLASQVHPAWDRLTRGGKALHTRNVFQVLGKNLDRRSNILVCWAKTDKYGVPVGGTRTAWVLAEEFAVPCYNLSKQEDREKIEKWLKSVKEKS
ncbi:hypothetical protein D3C78_741280 [compost metagenome]